MKRFAAAAAALMVAAPLTVTAADAQTYDRGYDRRDNDRYDRGRDDRRDGRRDWRDNDRRDRGRDDSRWDRRRHNGYYYNGRWNYGPPPAWAMARRDFRPGYQQWRRGERLPSYYRSHYREIDWRRERLRQPPRGYRYVRDDDRGETLLIGIATGVILGVILGAN